MFFLLAAKSDAISNFESLLNVVQRIGAFALVAAPGLIALSYVYCALLWVLAGSSGEMVRRARDQFKATTYVTCVIAGYFILKSLYKVMVGGIGG